MDTKTLMGRSARTLAVVLMAGSAAIGLADCQSPEPAASAGPVAEHAAGSDVRRAQARELARLYHGRPVDRLEGRVADDVAAGRAPDLGCVKHVVVEHPAGGFHLICVQVVDPR